MVQKLDIIRHMLSVIGESGVSNEESLHPSVLTATDIIDTEDADFQGPGWWFNTEYDLVLTQDNRGEVQIPGNALGFRLSNIENLSAADKRRYVKRGTRVYDAVNHTFSIGSPLTVDIIVKLDIEDMPAVASSYLLHKAALSMYVADDGDTFKTDKLEQRVTLAWQKLRAEEMKSLAVNALDSPTAQRMRMGTGSHNPNYIGGRIR